MQRTRKQACQTKEAGPFPHKGYAGRYARRGHVTHFILCVDFYSWVGEEEGYDGCVAIVSSRMQRGLAILQRQRRGLGGEGEEEKVGRGRVVTGRVKKLIYKKKNQSNKYPLKKHNSDSVRRGEREEPTPQS